MSGIMESFYNLTEKMMVYDNMLDILLVIVMILALGAFAVLEYFTKGGRHR